MSAELIVVWIALGIELAALGMWLVAFGVWLGELHLKVNRLAARLEALDADEPPAE